MSALKLDSYTARRIAAGWHPAAVAAAGGMSVRSAQRWSRGFRGLHVVYVEGFEADFASFEGRPPVRVSEWRRAA